MYYIAAKKKETIQAALTPHDMIMRDDDQSTFGIGAARGAMQEMRRPVLKLVPFHAVLRDLQRERAGTAAESQAPPKTQSQFTTRVPLALALKRTHATSHFA